MKLPAIPPRPLSLEPSDLTEIEGPLWRIFKTSGAHPSAWNELREFGPLPGMRFDPHPDGTPALHPGVGAAYASEDFYTAFAEVFSDSKVIDREEGRRVLAAWRPIRPIRVLDITGRNVSRIFGAASVQMTDNKNVTRAWARALFEDYGDEVDGIRSRSSVDNGFVITLFPRASDSFPRAPGEHQELSAVTAEVYVEAAARALGFDVI